MEELWVNWVLTMLFLISPLDSITGNKVVDDRLAHTDLPGECCSQRLPHWPCLDSVWLPLSHHSQALKSLSSCTSFTLYHPPPPLFMSLSFPCALQHSQPWACVRIKFLWTVCVCVFSRRSTAPVHPLSGRLQKLLRPRRVQVPQYPGAALLQVNTRTNTHRCQDTNSSPPNNLITCKKQKKSFFNLEWVNVLKKKLKKIKEWSRLLKCNSYQNPLYKFHTSFCSASHILSVKIRACRYNFLN